MAWVKFAVFALLIVFAGTKLTRSADVLGGALGLTAGWAGVLLLPLVTSLPELVSCLRAVSIEAPDLAAGNLLGSILFNLTIIALVDLLQGKGAMFHRIRQGHVLAASLGILLMVIAALGIIIPFPSLWGSWLGLDTLLIMGGYLLSARLLTLFEKRSLNREVKDTPSPGEDTLGGNQDHFQPAMPTSRALVYFLISAAIILFAGINLTDAADLIALETGLGRTFVGSILLAGATSLPEVVTTSTAARLGKLDMAVGNIFGANVFNIFILGLIDPFYAGGPLLQSVSSGHLLTALMCIGLTAVAMIGLVYRSEKSVGWIGYDSLTIIIGYLAAFYVLFTRG